MKQHFKREISQHERNQDIFFKTSGVLFFHFFENGRGDLLLASCAPGEVACYLSGPETIWKLKGNAHKYVWLSVTPIDLISALDFKL